PRPEAQHPPPLVANRERDPVPEPVVVAALPALLDQARGQQLLLFEPGPLAPGQHLVPRARRHPHPEAPQHVLAHPPPLPVAPRPLGLRRLPQVPLVVLRGPLEQLPQPRLPPPPLLGVRVLVLPLHLDAVPLGQRLHRLGKGEPLLFLHEPEDVPTRLAAEAVIE